MVNAFQLQVLFQTLKSLDDILLFHFRHEIDIVTVFQRESLAHFHIEIAAGKPVDAFRLHILGTVAGDTVLVTDIQVVRTTFSETVKFFHRCSYHTVLGQYRQFQTGNGGFQDIFVINVHDGFVIACGQEPYSDTEQGKLFYSLKHKEFYEAARPWQASQSP